MALVWHLRSKNLNHMKDRHVNRKLEWTLNEGSHQLVDLRLEKMMVNPLLRYCSLTVFGSFLLTTIATFNLCNQIGITWITNCFLAFSILLFAALLFIQDHYSERRTERKNISYKQFAPKYLSGEHMKNDKKNVIILVGLTIIALLLLSQDIMLHQIPALIFLSVAGTTLYTVTLLMIRKLLIEKLVLKQTIGSMSQRLLTSADSRNNFMAVAASQVNQRQQ